MHTIETLIQLLFNRESTCNALCKYYLPLLPQIGVVPLPLKIFIYFCSTSESNISDIFLFAHLEKFKLASVFPPWDIFCLKSRVPLNSSSLFEVPWFYCVPVTLAPR